MHGKKQLFAIILMMSLALPCVVFAEEADPGYELSDDAYQQLSDKAQKAYDRGQKLINYILFDRALQAFQDAADADPDNLEIRFLLAKLAEDEARKYLDGKAVETLKIAEQAYEDILDMQAEDVPFVELRRARNGLERVQESIQGQEKLDERRAKLGEEILEAKQEEIRKAAEERKKAADKRRKEEAKRREDRGTARGGIGGTRGSRGGRGGGGGAVGGI